MNRHRCGWKVFANVRTPLSDTGQAEREDISRVLLLRDEY